MNDSRSAVRNRRYTDVCTPRDKANKSELVAIGRPAGVVYVIEQFSGFTPE
jgi:hypothetical protein